MAVGILADSHGSRNSWRRALEVWGAVDLIVHAGDVLGPGDGLADDLRRSPAPLWVARGNVDRADLPALIGWPVESFVELEWQGRSIVASHGDDFTDFRLKALALGADLAITGHTHVASIVRERCTIFLNPGSAALPRGRDPASVARVDAWGITILTLDGVLLARESWEARP